MEPVLGRVLLGVPFVDVAEDAALVTPKVNGEDETDPPVPVPPLTPPKTDVPEEFAGPDFDVCPPAATAAPNMDAAFCCGGVAKRFVLLPTSDGALFVAFVAATAAPNILLLVVADVGFMPPNVNGCAGAVDKFVTVPLAFGGAVVAAAGPALPASEPNVGNVVAGALFVPVAVGLAFGAPNVNGLTGADGGAAFGVVVTLPKVNPPLPAAGVVVVVVEATVLIVLVNCEPAPNVGIVVAGAVADLLAALKPKLKAGGDIAAPTAADVIVGTVAIVVLLVLVAGCTDDVLAIVRDAGSLKPPNVDPVPNVGEVTLDAISGDVVVVVVAGAVGVDAPPAKENVGALVGVAAVVMTVDVVSVLPPN